MRLCEDTYKKTVREEIRDNITIVPQCTIRANASSSEPSNGTPIYPTIINPSFLAEHPISGEVDGGSSQQ